MIAFARDLAHQDRFPSTVKSPLVLELSGIGARATLEGANIPVQLDLPAVGENMQDHIIFCGNMWRASFLPQLSLIA